MANQVPTNSDEIDLGQLFQLIRKGFNKIFRRFLGFYIYIKKNIYILAALVLLGVGAGYGLKQVTNDLMKTEVIVRPNMDSRNYLYEVVDEIQANIKAKDTVFFSNLDISIEDLKGLKVTVESLSDDENKSDNGTEYLELLKGFEGSSEAISDIIQAEILSKSTLINHKISFYYKDAKMGQDYTKKLIEYINSNPYFRDLISVNNANIKRRIEKNAELLSQIDALISSYGKKLQQKDNQISDGKISIDNQEKLDVKGLFELKTKLIKDTEQQKMNLKEQAEFISVINFGKPQEVKKALYGNMIVLIPTLLITFFFLISILKYLNKKVLEM